jgi:hypothetical protein
MTRRSSLGARPGAWLQAWLLIKASREQGVGRPLDALRGLGHDRFLPALQPSSQQGVAGLLVSTPQLREHALALFRDFHVMVSHSPQQPWRRVARMRCCYSTGECLLRHVDCTHWL